MNKQLLELFEERKCSLPTIILNPISKKDFLFSILTFVFLFPSISNSQNAIDETVSNNFDIQTTTTSYYKTISFGEKISFSQKDPNATWVIEKENNNFKTTLKGNEINNFVFENPGAYKITYIACIKPFFVGCNHSKFPSPIYIKVSNVKMTFDFNNVLISKQINKGVKINRISLRLPIIIKSQII